MKLAQPEYCCAVAERLDGHPPFFLRKLHIVAGTIMGIEERFVP